MELTIQVYTNGLVVRGLLSCTILYGLWYHVLCELYYGILLLVCTSMWYFLMSRIYEIF